MKRANIGSFFYFERRLLEDYLNDQAKLGYHLKLGRIINKFEYDPNKNVYYHVDTQTKRRYFSQVKPNDDYIELFENDGYHFLGNVGYFHIFESNKRESIFSDENEENIVKEAFKKELPLIWSIIFTALACLFVLFNDYDTNKLSYMFLSDGDPLLWIYILLLGLSNILRTFIPLVRFKIKKEINYNYNYNYVFKRNFVSQVIMLCALVLGIACILVIDLTVIVVHVLLLIGIMILGLYLVKDGDISKKLDRIDTICLSLTVAIFVLFQNYNNALILKHPSILRKDFSQRTTFMEWSWYQLKDNEEYLYMIDVYEPMFNDMVLKDLIKYNQYTKEGDTYIFDDYVVIQKGNRFLRITKEFYEKDLETLEW